MSILPALSIGTWLFSRYFKPQSGVVKTHHCISFDDHKSFCLQICKFTGCHLLHRSFVKQYGPLWQKVLVYNVRINPEMNQ